MPKKVRAAVLSKIFPPYNMTVAELLREDGVSAPTLYTWRNKAKSEGRPESGRKATSEHWLAEAKLTTVIEIAALSEAVAQPVLAGKRSVPRPG